MARLRRTSTTSKAVLDNSEAFACSAAALNDIPAQTRDAFGQDFFAAGTAEEPIEAEDGTTLICKKASPRKDARKQVLLKPMNLASLKEDLSLSTTAITWDNERPRGQRKLYSPSKIFTQPQVTGTSLGSISSEADDTSDFSLSNSSNSEPSLFEIGAKIPDNLITHTKRQLFSPTKPIAQSSIANDSFLDVLSSTQIGQSLSSSDAEEDDSDSIAEEELPHTITKLSFATLVPTLRPTTTTDEECPSVRPCTPPQSPSKSKLVSPSKTKCRVPTPDKSSPDGFWSVQRVNDWNEQHSPQKIVRSPKKSHALLSDTSPSGSPRKTSPSKASRAELAAKKDFESRKKDIALAFLRELDDNITDGKIAQLAVSSGGVQLIWSKTLNSTAGRANWRRETTKSRSAGELKSSESKHFASIELAEKVIDDETRLLNVLAHEFCHLANFMISGVKDRPHGAEFKAWGRKCTLAFGDRGVKVTTKHTYDIDYKYIWTCTNDDCQAEFKRHSKSIDPARHNCGVCHAKIVQIKPVPRKAADGAKVGGFAGFVKEHYAVTKQDMPGATQKEVMVKLGEKYRAAKEEILQASVLPASTAIDLVLQEQVLTDVDLMAQELEAIALQA